MDIEKGIKNMFNISDLKTGYIVKTRNGKLNLVIKDDFNCNSTLIDEDYGTLNLSFSYDKSNKNKNGNSLYDIVAVYESFSISTACKIVFGDVPIEEFCETLWKEETKEVVQAKQVIADLKEQLKKAEDKLTELEGK